MAAVKSLQLVQKNLVLMFRAMRETDEDPYEMALSTNGFIPRSIPVLAFSYTHLDDLAFHYQCYHDYSGVIFTSPRSVQATALCGKACKETNNCKNIPSELSCFVVGKGTAEEARKLGFFPQFEEAGNAEILADLIIQKMSNDGRPFLYPCGNLKRDTLSVKLKDAGLSVKEIEVYETVPSPTIEEDFDKFVQCEGLPEYVVYFSPSGVKNTKVLILKESLPVQLIKFVAIGPTTQKELVSWGIDVFGVCSTPDPQGLLSVLLKEPRLDNPEIFGTRLDKKAEPDI
uniref:Uroporphyrinogen-III synthase n=1 Tax=Sinohyriopsis cumingii TaxID=165450 RepID=A0A6H0F2G7_SINCU|nr:uroporphyrinogen III synthetase [Sinohyriopsis cumingii]